MTVTTLEAGQWSAALGCAAAAAWWSARRGAWAACGAWLGLIGAFKPFAAPVAIWVLLDRTRARRSFLPMLIAALLPFALGLVVLGTELHLTWLNQARSIDWLWTPWSASVHGFALRLRTQHPYAAFAPVSPATTVLAWCASIAIIAATLHRVRHADTDRAFALLWVGSLLAFPLGWVYYGWLAFPPVFALYSARRLRQPLARNAVWMLMYPPVLLWMGTERLWATTGGSTYFWAVAALWLAIWLDRTGDRQK